MILPAEGGLFVTGTDTGVGKTLVSAGLIRRLRTLGLTVAGMKPVASGGEWNDGVLRNQDAETLLTASGQSLRYEAVNPYCFEPAIAPHIAAEQVGVRIRLETIRAAYDELAAANDLVVVEGVGGWRVPLSPELELADVATHLCLPVVLVVGLRLGCLSHARLSAEAIAADRLRLAGWIGSQLEPGMAELEQNLATLRALLPAPCLGFVPWLGGQAGAEQAAESLVDVYIG